MTEITKEKAIELLYNSIPYNISIENLEIFDDNIKFTWRNGRYKFEFTPPFIVSRINGTHLIRNDVSILIEELLNKYYKIEYMTK